MKLPTPAHRGPDGTGSYFDSYSKDQMLAFEKGGYEQGLEDAAKLCETLHPGLSNTFLSQSIRKLKRRESEAPTELSPEVIKQVCDEYNAWIRFHAAGGDYDEFLRNHVFANKGEAN